MEHHGHIEDIHLFKNGEPPQKYKKYVTGEEKFELPPLAEDQEKDADRKKDEELKEDIDKAIARYPCYDEPTTTLYDIFQDEGSDRKADAPEVELWYDFHPYNIKDPILLTLMVKDPITGKTI